MSKVQVLRALVEQRLAAAAEEIFGLFEGAIAEYEAERDHQRSLLDACTAPAGAEADSNIFVVSQEEFPPEQLDQEDSKTPNFKDEQDQFQFLQEAGITAFCPVSVKCEEDEEKPQCSMLHHSQTPGGKECGAPESDPDTNNEIIGLYKFEKKVRDECKSSAETQSGSNTLKNVGCNLSERSFSCSVCGKRFSQNSNLKTHMKIHTGEKPFSCSICNKRFIQKVHLKYHMASHSQTLRGAKHGAAASRPDIDKDIDSFKPEKIVRDGCKSPTTPQLGSNLMKNSGCNLSKRQFSCSVCGKRFSQNSNLKTHMKIHTGEKPFSCSICNRRFIQKTNMKSHMACHTGEKLFGCKTCDKKFNWRYQLKKHQCSSAELHQTADKRGTAKKMETAAVGGVEPAERNICLQARTEEETSHSTAFQTERRIFSCPDCSKTFMHKGHLQEHLQCHTGEKTFSCSVCNRSFPWKRNLQRHMQTHTGKSVIVQGVSRESLQPDHSRTQPRSDDGVLTRSASNVGCRAKKQFPCSQCGKVFGFKDSLMRHTWCHTGERPFSCPVCGRQFRDRGNMRKHMITHTGEKHFICSVCNQGFCWRKQLQSHKCDAKSISILHTSAVH